jgi:peptidoglycan/xylan/chitin deacetylase (PgdA/CDA1 family)
MAWLTVSYSFLVPPKQGLPILMYHKVSENLADGLTIPFDKLDKQFSYIREKGYQTIFFEELASLLNSGQKLPGKTLIITFDDAYKSFSTFALPLMEKYNIKATVFIPVAYMGKENAWDKGNDRIMSPEELKDLKKRKLVDYGIHSFLHSNYKNMVLQDMKEDLSNCINTLNPFFSCFCIPIWRIPQKR